VRITNLYLANGVINSIQNNLGRLARSQEQISTSSRLLRPSDDPTVLSQFMSIKATLSYNQQYDRNLDDGLSYLDMNDAAMGTVGDVLSKAGEYAVQAANDTYNPADRVAIAEQIDKMIDQVVDMANSSVGGKYIYAGTKNSRPPLTREGDIITYNGDTNGVYREVMAGTDYRIDAPGVTTGVQIEATNDEAKSSTELPVINSRQSDKDKVGIIKLTYNGSDINVDYTGYNLDGTTRNNSLITCSTMSGNVFNVTKGDLAGLEIEFPDSNNGADFTFTVDNRLGVFGNADISSNVVYNPATAATKAGVDKGIFDALFALRDSLRDNDTGGLQTSIGELQDKTDQLLQHRVQIGARTRHFEALKYQLLDHEVNLTGRLDKIEGADIARLSINVSQQQLSYQASLSIGSRMMQTSLLNFLS
jgi:flagellar hook-associated protein 3 FlgL